MSSRSKDQLSSSLVEIKSMSAPPQSVKKVACAIVVLLGEFPVDEDTKSSVRLDEKAWPTFKKFISNSTALKRMKELDTKTISPHQMRVAKECMQGLDEATVKKVSAAAAVFCVWVQKQIGDGDASA